MAYHKPFFIQYIYVVSWAHLVQEKVVCVLRIFQRVTLAWHGRRQFINAITGLETGWGHDLQSRKLSNVRLSIPEIAFADLVFLDTPGFDDTHIKDVDILKMIADWLKLTYVFIAVDKLQHCLDVVSADIKRMYFWVASSISIGYLTNGWPAHL